MAFNLEPRPSWLGDLCGQGLFVASGRVPAGAVVAIYRGDKLTTKEVFAMRRAASTSSESAGGGYLMKLGFVEGSGIIWVDAESDLTITARYINDALSPIAVNVRFDKDPQTNTANVVALRDIVAGEELFVDYGKAYWRGSDVKPSRMSSLLLGQKYHEIKAQSEVDLPSPDMLALENAYTSHLAKKQKEGDDTTTSTPTTIQ